MCPPKLFYVLSPSPCYKLPTSPLPPRIWPFLQLSKVKAVSHKIGWTYPNIPSFTFLCLSIRGKDFSSVQGWFQHLCLWLEGTFFFFQKLLSLYTTFLNLFFPFFSALSLSLSYFESLTCRKSGLYYAHFTSSHPTSSVPTYDTIIQILPTPLPGHFSGKGHQYIEIITKEEKQINCQL